MTQHSSMLEPMRLGALSLEFDFSKGKIATFVSSTVFWCVQGQHDCPVSVRFSDKPRDETEIRTPHRRGEGGPPVRSPSTIGLKTYHFPPQGCSSVQCTHTWLSLRARPDFLQPSIQQNNQLPPNLDSRGKAPPLAPQVRDAGERH